MRVAESGCSRGSAVLPSPASMEPQLEGCGKIKPGGAGIVVQVASMEPQLEGCGKLLDDAAEEIGVSASMEPQLEGCGKDGQRDEAAGHAQLQWSRNLRVAESWRPPV